MNTKQRAAAQAESVRTDPHLMGPPGMSCARCGARDCAIVPNVDPTFTKLQGVGLTQHAMICSEQCQGVWWCGLCQRDEQPDFMKHDEHSTWCNVAHPEVRAEWEKGRDFPTMKLTYMLASRGHYLPAFIMDGLFPGFPHADPPSFTQFKKAAAR